MICAKSGNGDMGLPGDPDDPVREGFVDGIHVIQFKVFKREGISAAGEATMGEFKGSVNG